MTSPYTRTTLTFHPHPSYPFAAGDSAVGLLCDLCGNSFQGKPGDWRYKQKLPGESPWPGSLPSVHIALPNPVSPERELIALYRWIDRGWMTRQVSNITRCKQVSVLSMDVTQQAWVEPVEATQVLEKGSIQWRQWTTQLEQDLLSLYAVAECVVTSNI